MPQQHLSAEELLLTDSFIHYLQGAPEADVLYWQQLMAANPEQQAEADKARELYQTMQGYPTVSLKAAAFARLKESLDTAEAMPPVRSLPYRWMAAAATIAAVAIASWLVFRPAPQPSFTTLAETGPQNRRQLTLPDGTSVLLSTASTLQLDENFNGKSRKVFLEGEAYFDVKANASSPFEVITRHTATTVLGTAFKVRSYPADQQAQIMLASGKVRVAAGAGSVELNPGEQAVCKNGGDLAKSTYIAAEMDQWINRKVEFINADLTQIIQALEKYYGVTVKLEKGPAGKVLFTGVFNNQQLNVLLDAISFTNNFTYQVNGNEVVIRF